MTITYHTNFIQGEDAWHAARCGLLTASEMKMIITPTLKAASNEKERTHLYELLAQRITKYVEPQYISDSMLRGIDDENDAIAMYSKKYAKVESVGFVTNDKWGFTIGYSPDGLVGSEGQVECKSRSQKYQVQTICDYVSADTISPDFMIQAQTGLLVTERKWCDLVSYCGGMMMATVRVFPDEKIQSAIVDAATAFEKRMGEKIIQYNIVLSSKARLVPTERKIRQEMFLSNPHGDFTAEQLSGGIPL
ncbi:MAG TPA: YqaJ viral recombinase family protein [Terriglobales bacterium]